MLGLFLLFTVGYALFITKVRFRFPLYFYLIIFASYSINVLWNYWRKKNEATDLCFLSASLTMKVVTKIEERVEG